MSDTVLQEIIGRAVSDEKFRALLLSHPDQALQGYRLSDDERKLLEDLSADSFDDFAGSLGDRTTKGSSVPGAG